MSIYLYSIFRRHIQKCVTRFSKDNVRVKFIYKKTFKKQNEFRIKTEEN